MKGINAMMTAKHGRIMRAILFIAVFYSMLNPALAQNSLNESINIASYCKVWGLLKYFHPAVSKGKFDWDKEFAANVLSVKSIASREELSAYYIKWISKYGNISLNKSHNKQSKDAMLLNVDLKWLNDSTLFTDELSAMLHNIVFSRNRDRKYYVKKTFLGGFTNFKNEKQYSDSVFPTETFRLLALSRYWNIINYFFPYRYLMDEEWHGVLNEMVPKFRTAKDTVAFHLAILELVTKTDDSHAGFDTRFTNKYFGFYWPPFQFKIIDNKAIVTGFYNDSLAQLDDIQLGDVIYSVDDVTVEDVIKEKEKYISASNEAAKLRDCYYVIFNGPIDSYKIRVERNGVESEKIVHRYLWRQLKFKWQDFNSLAQPWKIIPDENIGYVDMGHLRRKDVNRMMKSLENTDGIIFDIRNYPQGTMYKVSKHLNKKRTPFVKFAVQELDFPGSFKYTKPYYCGRNTKKYYKGKIVLLFNEETQSHGEFTCMALKTAHDVICIGSQTAGADGNVIDVPFPGGITTWMTGLAVYYPDGKETQRIGIQPDIEVKPTIEGIREKRDEVLDKAIEVIKAGIIK